MRLHQPPEPPPAPPPMMPVVYVRESIRWEYRQLSVDVDNLPADELLQEYGDEGWELAGILPILSRVTLYFKRRAE